MMRAFPQLRLPLRLESKRHNKDSRPTRITTSLAKEPECLLLSMTVFWYKFFLMVM